jgi:hypothetical protein
MGYDIPKRIEQIVGVCPASFGYFIRIFTLWQGYDFLMAICERE